MADVIPAPHGARRRGRRARAAERTARPVRFLPEMDRGIPFLDLMTPEQEERVHDASMRLLETKGIEFRDDESAAIWRAAGARAEPWDGAKGGV